MKLHRRQFLGAGAAGLGALLFLGCGGTDDDGGDLAPVWSTIPDQTWVVGVPVHLDLADYCSDEDLDALVFSLSESLPPGLSLVGSVITGTPTATFQPTTFVATAEEGA